MYLIGYITLLTLSFLEVFYNKKIIVLPLFVILIFISGIRYEVGIDYPAYTRIFTEVLTIHDLPLIEPGFKYLILLSKYLGINVFGFFFIMAAISISLYYLAIKKLEYKAFSLFLFFNTALVTVTFSGLRQGIVMVIFLLSIQFIYKRDIYKVIFLTAIAFSIHVTGILIFLCYLLPTRYVFKKSTILLSILGVLAFLYIDASSWIINFLPGYIKMKFSDYSTSFEDSITMVRVLQRVLLLLPFLLLYDVIVEKSDELKFMYYLYLIGFFIYIIFSANLAFATKINQFFRILEVIMFPMLMVFISTRSHRIIIFVALTIWSTLILLLFLNVPGNYPYKTMIFIQKHNDLMDFMFVIIPVILLILVAVIYRYLPKRY